MTDHRRRQHVMTTEQRFWSYVRKTDGCWIWDGWRRSHGTYGAIGANGRTVYAHRYSWELHNGPIPDGLVVCHHCDNPSCVRPDHLFVGTMRDNSKDMVRKRRNFTPGLGKHGSKHPGHKLVESQVLEIRALKATTRITCVELGRRYGVSPSTISMLLSGRHNWRVCETQALVEATRR